MKTKEAGTLGAAILAGVATGCFPGIEEAANRMIQIRDIYQPNQDNKEGYDEAYDMYCRLFRDLGECFDRTK